MINKKLVRDKIVNTNVKNINEKNCTNFEKNEKCFTISNNIYKKYNK